MELAALRSPLLESLHPVVPFVLPLYDDSALRHREPWMALPALFLLPQDQVQLVLLDFGALASKVLDVNPELRLSALEPGIPRSLVYALNVQRETNPVLILLPLHNFTQNCVVSFAIFR